MKTLTVYNKTKRQALVTIEVCEPFDKFLENRGPDLAVLICHHLKIPKDNVVIRLDDQCFDCGADCSASGGICPECVSNSGVKVTTTPAVEEQTGKRVTCPVCRKFLTPVIYFASSTLRYPKHNGRDGYPCPHGDKSVKEFVR